MTEYRLLEASSPHDLSNQINDYIKDGWRLEGNHTVAPFCSNDDYSGIYFFQMISREEI